MFVIQNKDKLYFTGEIGCNHCGSIEMAKVMIYFAKCICGLDAVKFQKRTVKDVLKEIEYNMPHPVQENSFGATYGEHREFLEFTVEQHKELKLYCDKLGIDYGCSVWDMTAASEILSLDPSFIKIPSACNTNVELIDYLAQNYAGDIHVSMGMLDHIEKEQILNYFLKSNFCNRLVIYHCVSGYPVAMRDLKLLEITDLINKCDCKVKGIGFSGHHKGTVADIAAIALGAKYIERHFTLNCNLKGTDQSASLEPDEYIQLINNGKNVLAAMEMKSENLMDLELIQRRKLKWNR